MIYSPFFRSGEKCRLAATLALAQQNWVLKTWTILLFAPVFERFPKKTITSLAFSTLCLWRGHSEKQVLLNTIGWLYRNGIFRMGGALFANIVLQAGFGNNLGSFFVHPQTNQNSRVMHQVALVALLCSIAAYYLSGIKKPGIYVAISCAAIAFGFFIKKKEIQQQQQRLRQQDTVVADWIRRESARHELEEIAPPVENPSIPEDLLEDEVLTQYPCAITKDPVHHPVLDPTNGDSLYEHSVVLQHLRRNPSSPATRNPLHPRDLIRLPALERFIESRIANPSAIDEKLKAEAEAELQKQKQLIRKYSCAISKKLILHPVLDPTNGVTLYECAEIMRALRERKISPTTGQDLKPMQLIQLPLVERFLQSHRENAGAINEELEREAEAELESRQQEIQSRLSSKSE